MKDTIRRYLGKIINWLQKKYEKLDSQESEDLPYHSLSPIANADIKNDYKKSLDWALSNRKKEDIKNIALTGPYGSGKSSILKTYIADYKGKDLHFLYVSLATFKEEEDGTETTSRNDLLRRIELSILQQIFYHEEDRRIPDSRFSKIKKYTKANLLITTFTLFLLIASVLHLIYPSLIESLVEVKFSPGITNIFHYASFIIVIIVVLIFIYKSIRTISNLKINKLDIQNAKISVDESVNKSILNHHLDEILYFFEVTKYNVMIIEDLDRFKQTEIFTKLREINLLLNNSKKIKKEVVFIYAVRDDMFKEENERTKFFDFIIPVIPIINPSNSSQKLLEKQALNGYKISENLIDTISLFIDDMRLLHNISNEFYLYSQKLNKNLNQDKLLAAIVYKNIFPNDFTLLSNNGGLLYKAINNKQRYISAEISRLNGEINLAKEKIKELENLKIKDIKELRYMYLAFYLQRLPGIISFRIGNTDQTLNQMVSDINFDYLINNKAHYLHVPLNGYGQRVTNQIAVQFAQIEKEVDNTHTYSERVKQIEEWNNNKVEVLKNEIQELEKKKIQAKDLKVRELLESGHVDIDIPDGKQKKLVSVLLRNGFIDEDYLDYVSIFYEGSITKNDHQFLINIKSQISTEFDYKLHKIDKLIEKINPLEFNKEYSLNYALFDFVLGNSKYNSIKDAIFEKIKDESEVSIKFIDGFLDATQYVQDFVKQLTKRWINIWSFLENKSSFTHAKKDKYFTLIIEYADVNDIKRLYDDPFFKKYLLQKKDFLSIISDDQRLKNIVKALNIKFTSLEFNVIPKQLRDYIYGGNFYEINVEMIRLQLKVMDKLKEADFDTKNYFAIMHSECDELIGYINTNINDYVEKVYLKLENNIKEDPSCLIQLFNNKNILFENKKRIVERVETVLTDLSLIEDIEIHKVLFKEGKISPAWDNIFNGYEANGNSFSEFIIGFLDIEYNVLELSKSKIKEDVGGETKNTTFISTLITTESINNKSYGLILKSVPYEFSELDLSTLSEDKILLLLENGILSFNPTNYNSLKKNFTGLHFKFLELNKAQFITNISEYDLNSRDILLLLKSTKFSIKEKNVVLEKIDENMFSSEQSVLKGIGELILKDNSFRVSDTILKDILVNGELSVEQRVRIFNWKQGQIPSDYIEVFLNSLGEPYSDIAINGKRPVIPNTNYNLTMSQIILNKNYISSYDTEEKGIRVSTFRKNNETVE